MDFIFQLLRQPQLAKPLSFMMDSVRLVVTLWRFLVKGSTPVAPLAPTRTSIVPAPVVSLMIPSRAAAKTFVPAASSWTIPVLIALILVFIVIVVTAVAVLSVDPSKKRKAVRSSSASRIELPVVQISWKDVFNLIRFTPTHIVLFFFNHPETYADLYLDMAVDLANSGSISHSAYSPYHVCLIMLPVLAIIDHYACVAFSCTYHFCAHAYAYYAVSLSGSASENNVPLPDPEASKTLVSSPTTTSPGCGLLIIEKTPGPLIVYGPHPACTSSTDKSVLRRDQRFKADSLTAITLHYIAKSTLVTTFCYFGAFTIVAPPFSGMLLSSVALKNEQSTALVTFVASIMLGGVAKHSDTIVAPALYPVTSAITQMEYDMASASHARVPERIALPQGLTATRPSSPSVQAPQTNAMELLLSILNKPRPPYIQAQPAVYAASSILDNHCPDGSPRRMMLDALAPDTFKTSPLGDAELDISTLRPRPRTPPLRPQSCPPSIRIFIRSPFLRALIDNDKEALFAYQ
ncbi:hypothetical protein PENSPDRAFT_111400 [Peniophora sp. CONT]|nr:hypothetical protein PENSPDRAFT_111400 [Peniophora sp. CONT]